MKIFNRLIKEEKGATVVLVALCITVLVGMAAIVTDVGLVYLNKWKLTNAVDASVLAGAQELPQSPDSAVIKALDYAAKNGLDPTTVQVTVSIDKSEISMVSQKEVNLFFARAIGYSKSNVEAKAKAKVGPLKSVMGVAPLGIQEQNFIYGQQYQLKMGQGVNGWFGPLTLGSSGASNYEANLEKGYNLELKVGDIINTETGDMSGPTKQGIKYRIDNSVRTPPNTYDNFDRDCLQVLMIPVIRPVSYDNGQVKSVEIVGFAAFFVDRVPSSGNDSIVTGYFVNQIATGDIDFNQTGYGLNGVKLIQ